MLNGANTTDEHNQTQPFTKDYPMKFKGDIIYSNNCGEGLPVRPNDELRLALYVRAEK